MVADQGVQQAIEGAKAGKRCKEPPADRPGLGIGVDVDVARGEKPLPHRDPMEQGPALGFVQASALQTRPQRLAFDFAHRAFQASQEAIMRITGIVHPVLIREEGAKQRAHCQHMMPVFGAARESTQLQPQHEADMVHGDLGEEPLKPVPALGRRAALPLILVHDQHAGRGPAQGNGIVV